MADENDYLLSTSDNPHNPWTDWDGWNTFDMRAGHHTLAYLAQIMISSDEMSQPDQDRAYDLAVAEIIEENVNGLYVLVPKPQ